jgi:hypothetical protein
VTANVFKQIFVLCLVVVMTSACAGKKPKGGGGGGGGPPPDGGDRPQAQKRAAEDKREIERLNELAQRLQEDLDRKNNPFLDNVGFNNALAINGNGVDPNQFVAPGVSGLPGQTPVITGNPFDSGVQAGGNPLDPNAQPQVLEAGVNPLLQVGNPQPANLRSSASRQPATAQQVPRGLASH